MPRPHPPQICPGRLESVMESPRLTTPSHVRKSEDDSKFSPMLNLTTHRESKVPKWELGGRIFQMNFNIFFENVPDNGT